MRIAIAQYRATVSNIFVQKGGVSEAHAQLATDVLLFADRRGIVSHGVARLPTYIELLQAGAMNATPTVRVVHEAASAARIDANNGLGFVAAHEAMRVAMRKAKETGVAFVAVGNTNHYGCAGYYALLATQAQLIGACGSNSTALVATTSSNARVFGTNPLAAAFPGQPPICIDMATSGAAYGKVEVAHRERRALPPHWVTRGNDASALLANREALEPLGRGQAAAHKGVCLSVLVDLLATSLSAARYMTHAPTFSLSVATAAAAADADAPDARRRGIGHFCVAIDPAAFGVADYDDVVSAYARELRDTHGSVVPGDPERRQERDNEEAVEIADDLMAIIERLERGQ